MVVVIAMAFFLSWTPFYVVNTIGLLTPFMRQSNFLFTLLNTHLLGFLNSLANPFIYSIMSGRFRKSFRNIIVTLCCFFCTRMRGTLQRSYARSTRNNHNNQSTMLSYTTQNSLVHEQDIDQIPGRTYNNLPLITLEPVVE